MAPSPPSDEDIAALEHISAARFYQSLTVPATAAHGPLKVTYAVIGNQDRDAPTILLFGGMFGGRWIVVDIEHLAAKMGVRLVCCDRYIYSHLFLVRFAACLPFPSGC